MLRGRSHGIGFRLCRRAHMMTQGAQQFGEQCANKDIVFDHKDPKRVHNLTATRIRKTMYKTF
jgi:hypothetical protein